MMDERNKKILFSIIEQYIQTAEPIGSRFLSKLAEVNLSPATIRNVMVDLTELGYIEQPHTSAGRVPTDKGYRFYVDNWATAHGDSLSKTVQHHIEAEIAKPVNELDGILKNTTRILAGLTECMALVLSPRPSSTRLKMVDFVGLRGKQILVVLVTQSGIVSHKVVEIRGNLDQKFLDHLSSFFNENFYDKSLAFIRENLVQKIAIKRKKYSDFFPCMIRLGKKAFESEDIGKLYIEGRTNMFQFPEFARAEELRNFYLAIEDQEEIISIMNLDPEEEHKTKVRIGLEIASKNFGNCSVISSQYGKGDNLWGTIGILGPTRMDYGKVIQIIDFTAKTLSERVKNLLSEG